MNESWSRVEGGPILILPGSAWDARALAAAGLPAQACPSVTDLCREIVAGAAGAVLGPPALAAAASALADALLLSPLAPNFPIVVPAPGFSLPPGVRTLEYLANVVPLDPGMPPAGVVGVFQGLLRACWGAPEGKPRAPGETDAELLEAVPAGVLLGDLRGGVSYVNARFLEMLDLEREQVLSDGVPWDQLTAPESADRGPLAVRELETTGCCRPYRKTFLTRLGRRVPALVSASVLRRGPGEAALVAVFLVDLLALEPERGATPPAAGGALPRVREEELLSTAPTRGASRKPDGGHPSGSRVAEGGENDVGR